MKRIAISALSVIGVFAIVIGFSFREATVNKAYATGIETDVSEGDVYSGYDKGESPILGSTMFKVSSDRSALLLATVMQNYGDVYEVGYDITVSTGAVEPINTPTANYYSSITLGEKTWTSSDIFGETYAEAKMIIWEIGYDPNCTYNIKVYARVGYRSQSDGKLGFVNGNCAREIKRKNANVLSDNHTLSFEKIDDTKSVSIGNAIGTLPEISDRLGYRTVWMIDDAVITPETKWRWSSDKTAVATYVENPVHDNSARYTADFEKNEDGNYLIATSAIDASFSGELVDVLYNGSSWSDKYEYNDGDLVFNGVKVRDMDFGDYDLCVYTTTDTYKIKISVVTDAIKTVEDLNAMAAYGAANETAHTGYYVLGNDIDGGTVNVLSQYCHGGTYTTNGFRGVFDGRGHVIKNVTLADGRLFNGLGKGAIVKNFALIDPVQTDMRTYVLAGEVQNAAIGDVLVRSASVSIAGGLFNGSRAENVVFISTGGTGAKQMTSTLTDGSRINNAVYVANGCNANAANTFGYGSHIVTSVDAYAGTNDLLDALSENDYITGWDSPYISYDVENGRVRFGDLMLIDAEIELGIAFSIDGLGDVTAIEGTLSKVTLKSPNVITADELNKAAGVKGSESLAIKFFADDKEYYVNAAFITGTIKTVADLNAMAAYGAEHATEHTGYYVLGNDIDGGTVNVLSQYCGGDSYTTNGFRGVFDGRGHVIKNVTLADGRLFNGLGKGAIVKNFALIDPVQTVTLPYVLAGEVQNAAIGDVLVRSASVSIAGGLFNGSRAENVVFISTGGTGAKRMTGTLTDGSRINNAVYVSNGYDTVNTFGAGTHTVTSAKAYNSTDDMLNDLFGKNYMSDWCTSYISYDTKYIDGNTKIRRSVDFNGNAIMPSEYAIDGKYLISVPDYSHTADKLISGGTTDYRIVIASSADVDIYNAAKELRSLIFEATGASLKIVADKDVSWSESAKYICLDDNALATAAGSVRPKVNVRGYSIKRIGKSLFLRGSDESGTAFSVYGLLSRILGFECYSSDEYEIARTADLYLPDIDITVEPDIEYVKSFSGLINGDLKQRLNYNDVSFMYPEGGEAWHNSFDYFPPEDYLSTHPYWYNDSDPEQICYTAHGNASEYASLVSATVAKMKTIIANNPDKKVVTFMQQDVAEWCTCKTCRDLNSKYGTDAASVIKFMNAVVAQVETWRETAYPERDDIRYLFFAYCTTGEAPVKTVNGKYVQIDNSVKPNEKIGVVYVMDAKVDYTREQIEKWHALVGDNLYCWFYQTYFKNYFLPYCEIAKIQADYRAINENGAIWLYYQSQWKNANSSGFEVLKAYLESKLGWNVNADTDTLTDNFFKYYFRDASASMRSYYDEVSARFVSRYDGTHEDNCIYVGAEEDWIIEDAGITKDILLRWQGYLNDAYNAIGSVADLQLKKAISDRIRLESLSVRYMLIQHFGTEVFVTDEELTMQKLLFKKDCKDLNVTYYSESRTIDELWPEAFGPVAAAKDGDIYSSEKTYNNGSWKSFE